MYLCMSRLPRLYNLALIESKGSVYEQVNRQFINNLYQLRYYVFQVLSMRPEDVRFLVPNHTVPCEKFLPFHAVEMNGNPSFYNIKTFKEKTNSLNSVPIPLHHHKLKTEPKMKAIKEHVKIVTL